jgi:hexosaminidase
MRPALIPYPSKLTPMQGMLELKRGCGILASPGAAKVAAYLRRRMGETLGWKPALGKPGIRLELVKGKASEAFTLIASPGEGLLIQACTREGLLNGCQTLLQLGLPSRGKATLHIPALRIEDAPRFGWRGMLLDCCRHYFSVKAIKGLIDMLALHKFNRLHWHLTEDQGWRLEIKKYPRLKKVAAWRREKDGKRYGGTYTNAQVREIVAYAGEAGITVVPEIEMPGHSTAALAAYPELSCTGGPFKVLNEWGVHKDIYCAGKESSFKFLEGVLDEVVKLFPAPWIHVGADEAPKDRWKACPHCQKRITDEGLKNEFDLQTYFVGRMAKYLKRKGKTVVAWDEILEGGAPQGSVVQNWRDYSGKREYAVQAIKAGRQALVSPYGFWYLDWDVKNTPLRKSWSFDPMPPGLSRRQQALLLGGECCVWTEGITEPQLNSRVFPRMLGISERLWRGKAGLGKPGDFSAFMSRVRPHLASLAKIGVKSGPMGRLKP